MQAKIALGKTAKQGIEDGPTRKRGGVASGGEAVAARTLGMLSTTLEHAVRHRLIAHNPARVPGNLQVEGGPSD